MKHLSVIAGLGASCLAVTFCHVLISKYLEIHLLSFSLLMIIPIGAFGVGYLGTLGGVAAAKMANHRPSWVDAVSIISFAAITMFAIYYLDYKTAVVGEGDEAVRVEQVIPFSKYFEIVTTKSKHTISVKNRKVAEYEAGDAGYFYVGLYFLGFLAGGWLSFRELKNALLCTSCESYMKKLAGTESAELTIEEATEAHTKIRNGNIEMVRDTLTWKPEKRKPDKKLHCVIIEKSLWGCSRCPEELLIASFRVRNEKNEWVANTELTLARKLAKGMTLKGVITKGKYR